MDDGPDAAVERALLAALPGVFPAAAVTTVVADPAGGEAVAAALARLLALLPRAGVPRGRVTVLMAAGEDGAPFPRAAARALRERLGVPVLTFDPARSDAFVAGTSDGLAVALCDELREAEAVLTVGAIAAGGSAADTHALVVPGLADAVTRRALGADPGRLAAARTLVSVDLALGIGRDAHGAWRADALPAARP